MAKCIKSVNELGTVKAYNLEYSQDLTDSKSLGMVFRHKKSGARVCIISNDDNNKVFFIGFRTPPKDSTGVAHIIEHSVLCGSTKFPSKDPFIELCKGSLNTFLNAMTYPDKTVYPVASCNDKDFDNLIDVYMDAVLHPNIYKRKEIFMQEGWHYELEDEKAELKLNGIVYSEMKGAFSSPEQVLGRGVMHSLFPDTVYGVESGGDPDYIPDLTYENFLAFHKQYYHPSNSYIYLYGDMDIEEKLEWLDREYLNAYDKITVDSEITDQKKFSDVKEEKSFYSLGDNEDEKDNTYLSYNVVSTSILDVEKMIALQIINTVLLGAPGAPLKQALLDSGICKDIMSGATDIKQPFLSIIAKNSNVADKEKFISVIMDTLTKLVEEGLNKNSLLAAINNQEFEYREADNGSYPKGLITGLNLMSSWLYDDKCAFPYLFCNIIYDKLKKNISTGYFEKLIKELIIDSKHASCYILAPKRNLTAEKDEKLNKKLQEYKATLSSEEINELVLQNKKLLEYQSEVDTKEIVEMIPMLERTDIEKKAVPFCSAEKEVNGIKVIHQNIFTNGIAYVRMFFDLDGCDEDLIPYLGILKTAFGYVDTDEHSFLELNNEVSIHTGEISSDLVQFYKKDDNKYYKPMFKIASKLLYTEFETMFSLCSEMILKAKYQDTKRLYEILLEIRSRLQMRMNAAAHVVALTRGRSYYLQSAYYNELTSGIAYYDFINDLCNNYDEKKDDIVKKITDLSSKIFHKKNLMASVTADDEGYAMFCDKFTSFSNSIDKKEFNAPGKQVVFKLKKANEGFTTPGQVQYYARVGNFIDAGFKQTGSLKVLSTILGYDYLWNRVRVKGGAYGCMNGFATANMSGNAFFVSYRDPRLKETDEVYKEAADYVRSFEADEREMTKYIIGTMSNVDIPLTPSMKGDRSFDAYISGITFEDVQKDRDEILNTSVNDIRNTADIVKALYDADNVCAIGNEEKIKENKDMFGEVKPLMK